VCLWKNEIFSSSAHRKPCCYGILDFLYAQKCRFTVELGVTEIVVESIRTWQPDHAYTIADLHVFVRKSAHMLLYFVFGGLVLHALSIRTRPDLRRMLLALTVCVSYALTDEWHQLYVPGRGAQLRDVLIDTSGAMLGILTYKLAHLLITRLYLHRQ
jgi:VanZ family protein